MFAAFDICYQIINCKKPRREVFNLKNRECFHKIRLGRNIENTEIQKLLDEKLKCQRFIESSQSKVAQDTAQMKITQIEEEISKMCAERNCNIVKNYIKSLGTPDGNFSQIGMWKLKIN